MRRRYKHLFIYLSGYLAYVCLIYALQRRHSDFPSSVIFWIQIVLPSLGLLLVEGIYRFMRWMIQSTYQQAIRAFEQGDCDQSLHILRKLEKRGKPDSPALTFYGEVLLALAKKNKDHDDVLWQQAAAKYQAALERDFYNLEARYQLGYIQLHQAQHADAPVAQELLTYAIAQFSYLTRVAPKVVGTWVNWANALAGQARYAEGESADALYEQAYAKFDRATKQNADEARVWAHWANIFVEHAQRKAGSTADELFAQAYDKFQQAVSLRPDFRDAWGDWGTALARQACTKAADVADQLFEQAYSKYQQVVLLNPQDALASCNWAKALIEHAQKQPNGRADELQAQAYDKYRQAVTLDPTFFGAWSSWASALLRQVQKADGQERQTLLQKAEENLLQAESCQKGAAAYNLACVYALVGDEAKCHNWLRVGEAEKTLETREYAMNDWALASMRDKDWFQAIRWKGEQ